MPLSESHPLTERHGLEVTAVGLIPEDETAEALLLRLVYEVATEDDIGRFLALTSYGRDLDDVVENLRSLGWGLAWYTEH